MIIQKNSFEGGINSDLASRLLPPNQLLNLMNGRVGVTSHGRDSRFESVPGSTQISQNVYPPYGTPFCIGSTVDVKRSRLLYALFNSMGDHGIYCLDYSSPAAPVVYAVLYDSQVTGGLGFSKSFRIDRNMKVVGDLLYWTDNNEEPRRINIEAAIKMNHASYNTTVAPYSWPMDQSVIRIIRRPPGVQPSFFPVTGGTTPTAAGRFAGAAAVRYRYRDGEVSVVGTPSELRNWYDIDPISGSPNYLQYFNIGIPMVVGNGEAIDQDVQAVELLISYGNDPNYFIVKTWDKDNPTDLAAINSHNAGVTNLNFDFYNNINGIAISDEDSVKPEDAVPIKVKTLETALDRLFLANYTAGYDTPTQSSLLPNLSSSGFLSDRKIKYGSSYQIGIRFRDYYGRKSAAYTTNSMIIATPDRTYADTFGVNDVLGFTLSNAAAEDEIPDWAYYYDIMMTKNLRTRFYMQAKAAAMKYAMKDANGLITYQDTYSATAYGVAVDLTTLQSQGKGYIFNDGDLCRLYSSASAAVNELAVIATDGNYVILQLQDLGSFVTQPNILFELYTPYTRQVSETFYTTGRSYKVTDPGLSSRTYSVTSGTFPGDTFPYNYPSVNVERMSPSDKFWRDNFVPFGSTSIQSNFGQVEKTNFVRFSNTIIPGSSTNGLSTFDALDEKPMPQSMGSIQKLQNASKTQELGNVLLVIGQRQTASAYLGEVQLVGAAANAVIASSPGVIGTVNILRGNYGTQNPETVIEWKGLVFFLDAIEGCVVQYSQAGLDDVSRYNMKRFFERYCSGYLEANSNNLDNINGFHHIPFGIFPPNSELVCTLPGLIYSNYADVLPSYSGSVPSYASSIINRFDVFDSLAKTMCFKIEGPNSNRWPHNFEFMAEWYDYIGDTMFAFKNGVPYVMFSNTAAYNTFFGTQYPMRACITANLNPSLLKTLSDIAVEASHKPGFVVALTAIPNQQITDIAGTDDGDNGKTPGWVNQEGVLYSAFGKDRLSPNASGTAEQKLFTGDQLTDFSIFVMCEWSSIEGLLWCQFLNVGFESSRGQKRIASPDNS